MQASLHGFLKKESNWRRFRYKSALKIYRLLFPREKNNYKKKKWSNDHMNFDVVLPNKTYMYCDAYLVCPSVQNFKI